MEFAAFRIVYLRDNPIPLGHKKFDIELLACFFKAMKTGSGVTASIAPC